MRRVPPRAPQRYSSVQEFQAATMQPGDLLLLHTHHLVSKLIRWGERMYGPGAHWNHAAVYVGEGKLVEALSRGIVISPIGKYRGFDYLIAHVQPQGIPPLTAGNGEFMRFAERAMRANAAEFALSCVGEKYGYATIAAIAAKVLTRGRVDFGLSGTHICSGLAARCLERLGYDFEPWDPEELTPAWLADNLP